MKKCYLFLLPFLACNLSAQVGINTTNPKATLDVTSKADLNQPDGIIVPRISGDLLSQKDAVYGPEQNGAIIFVTSPVTTQSIKTQGVLNTGFFVYDANYTHPDTSKGVWNKVKISDLSSTSSLYAARGAGDLEFLDLGINLLGSAVKTIPIRSTTTNDFTVEIPSVQVTYDSGTQDGYYTVPADGIYHIDYSFRTGQGVTAEVLSNDRPGLIITKTDPGSTTPAPLDYRLFGGVELLDLGALGVANVSLTQGQISHIYRLKEGDILRFGIVQGGLNLGTLTDTSAEISIFKM